MCYSIGLIATAANKRANSHNFKTYIWIRLQFLSFPFTDWAEVFIVYESSMEENNTFREIRECFWRKKIVVTVTELEFVWQTSTVVVFSEVYMRLFYLTRSLIDRCQFFDRYLQKNVSKFVWKPFKPSLSLLKLKYALVKPLP